MWFCDKGIKISVDAKFLNLRDDTTPAPSTFDLVGGEAFISPRIDRFYDLMNLGIWTAEIFNKRGYIATRSRTRSIVILEPLPNARTAPRSITT